MSVLVNNYKSQYYNTLFRKKGFSTEPKNELLNLLYCVHLKKIGVIFLKSLIMDLSYILYSKKK